MGQKKGERMKMNRLNGLQKIFFLVAVFIIMILPQMGLCEQHGSQEQKINSRYVAYYFYTSKRCGPCTTIEKLSKEAVTQNFKDQIAAGKLQWQALNLEKSENRHFIEDFQLYTKSVILAEYKEDKVVRWENLTNIWHLYRNKEKYFDYIVSKTNSFMEKN